MNAHSRLVSGNRLLVFLIAAALLIAVSTYVLTAQELLAVNKTQAVSVEVRGQEGTPLAISSINTVSSNPQQPVFSYEVINSGDKPVSAYAIRHDVTVGNGQSSGVTLTTLWSLNTLLYPHASNPEDFRGRSYGAEVSKVVLSVDFVEFIDGTTWGQDTFKMSEKVAGNRAGGRAVLNKLRDKSSTRGLTAVLEAINGEIMIAPRTDKSQLWKDAFEEGIKTVRVRLQNANRKGGLPALERELIRPFDASERRQ